MRFKLWNIYVNYTLNYAHQVFKTTNGKMSFGMLGEKEM